MRVCRPKWFSFLFISSALHFAGEIGGSGGTTSRAPNELIFASIPLDHCDKPAEKPDPVCENPVRVATFLGNQSGFTAANNKSVKLGSFVITRKTKSFLKKYDLCQQLMGPFHFQTTRSNKSTGTRKKVVLNLEVAFEECFRFGFCWRF